jgi:hypothetical protein
MFCDNCLSGGGCGSFLEVNRTNRARYLFPLSIRCILIVGLRLPTIKLHSKKQSDCNQKQRDLAKQMDKEESHHSGTNKYSRRSLGNERHVGTVVGNIPDAVWVTGGMSEGWSVIFPMQFGWGPTAFLLPVDTISTSTTTSGIPAQTFARMFCAM